MKFLEAVEAIRGTENVIKRTIHNRDYYELRDNILTHVTYLKNEMEFPMCATIRAEMLETNDWTVIEKEEPIEKIVERTTNVISLWTSSSAKRDIEKLLEFVINKLKGEL